MSAAFAISSVIAVDGVSGEIATPTFMFRARIALMTDNGSAARQRQLTFMLRRRGTCGLEVEAVERAARVCDVVDPLRE
jgi:hypothetical protein